MPPHRCPECRKYVPHLNRNGIAKPPKMMPSRRSEKDGGSGAEPYGDQRWVIYAKEGGAWMVVAPGDYSAAELRQIADAIKAVCRSTV